jgi:hypothetical protein
MRDKETPDHYHTLGLASTATDLEIKARYRVLSKKHHPDMGGNQLEMAKINGAYRVLSDTFKRAIYDAERKRTLHVPPRTTPTTAQQAAAARRPAPRAQTQFHATPKRRTNWWARFAWGFAALVIVAGLLMHLPIAEALGTDTPDIQTTKPLDVTYEPDTSSTPSTSTTSSSSATAPQNTTATTPTPTTTTPTVNQQKNEACSANTDASCQQTESKKNCITKSIGFYKHTVCTAPSGTTTCSTSLGGDSYRSTECR